MLLIRKQLVLISVLCHVKCLNWYALTLLQKVKITPQQLGGFQAKVNAFGSAHFLWGQTVKCSKKSPPSGELHHEALRPNGHVEQCALHNTLQAVNSAQPSDPMALWAMCFTPHPPGMELHPTFRPPMALWVMCYAPHPPSMELHPTLRPQDHGEQCAKHNTFSAGNFTQPC